MINANIPVILEDLAILNMWVHQGMKIEAIVDLILIPLYLLWKGPLERNPPYAELRMQVGAVLRKSGNA